jgi:hypothetical protein
LRFQKSRIIERSLSHSGALQPWKIFHYVTVQIMIYFDRLSMYYTELKVMPVGFCETFRLTFNPLTSLPIAMKWKATVH